MAFQVLVGRARGRGEADELRARRRFTWLVDARHAALLAGLGAGVLLVERAGWGFGHPRWLGLKVGLTLALILPLEVLNAWNRHGFLRRGLAETSAPPFSKALQRGAGVEEMLAMLARPLLGLTLPLLVWLSLARPF